MKKIGFIAVAVLFVSAFGMNVIGQVPAAIAPAKVAWIDTSAFDDEKTGIQKFINAYKALANEAKPRETELTTISTRVQALSDELAKMQANKAVPFDEKAALAKKDEGERLAREYEFKKKEYDAFIQKRGGEIVGKRIGQIARVTFAPEPIHHEIDKFHQRLVVKLTCQQLVQFLKGTLKSGVVISGFDKVCVSTIRPPDFHKRNLFLKKIRESKLLGLKLCIGHLNAKGNP